MDVRKLALDHWDYIRELLEIHGEDEETLRIVGFHYVEAFVHGWKHAMEHMDRLTLPVTENEEYTWSEYSTCHTVDEKLK